MKKIISLLLALGLFLSQFVSCSDEIPETTAVDGSTEATTEENVVTTEPVVDYNSWEYHEYKMKDIHFALNTTDVDKVIQMIYSLEDKESYVYEYYQSIFYISVFASVVDHYLTNQNSDAENYILKDYFSTVSLNEYIAPYEDIMLECAELLFNRGVAFADISAADMLDLMRALPDGIWGQERYTILALSFCGIDTTIRGYAESLLGLSAKYPDYEGPYLLTESDRENLEALVAACQQVAEKRNGLYASWVEFFSQQTETFTGVMVSEIFLSEFDAVMVTILSELPCMVEVPNMYISNLVDFVGESGIVPSDKVKPMQSPVVLYLPVSYYSSVLGFENPRLRVTIYNAANVGKSEYVSLSLNPEDFYTQIPVTLPDSFLQKTMEKIFGRQFTESDLLNVYDISFYKYTSGKLQMQVFYRNRSGDLKEMILDYEELMGQKAPSAITEEMCESLTYFHGLRNVRGSGSYKIPADVAAEIEPYCVVTEWYEQRFDGRS